MPKYLIINADDYGMCNSANEAVEELLSEGKMKSATIMMPCDTAIHAAEFAVSHPEYAIGVHLTMTSEWNTYRWKPLSDGKTLVDEHGYMWKTSKQVGKFASYKDLEAEIRAQVDKALALGMNPSHLDNHMGSLYGHHSIRFGLLKMTLKICGEYGYPFRMFIKTDKRLCPRGINYNVFKMLKYLSNHWANKYHVYLPDYLLFPDWTDDLKQSYEHYIQTILKIWTDIPDGITETYVHPAKASDELKDITASWKYRDWEYQLMKDPETYKYLHDHGVTLIDYREMVEIINNRKR